MKKSRNLLLSSEIKATDMIESEKMDIIERVQKIKSFYAVGKVFNKRAMKKEIYETNIFFNYAIKVLFNDVIIPRFKRFKRIDFVIGIDNRNIRVGELNNLENYLKTEFCFYDYNFLITYYDSKTNFGIQLADLIVNTFYNYYKDIKLIKNLVLILNENKYNLSMFPLTKMNDDYYN